MKKIDYNEFMNWLDKTAEEVEKCEKAAGERGDYMEAVFYQQEKGTYQTLKYILSHAEEWNIRFIEEVKDTRGDTWEGRDTSITGMA